MFGIGTRDYASGRAPAPTVESEIELDQCLFSRKHLWKPCIYFRLGYQGTHDAELFSRNPEKLVFIWFR